MSDETSFFIVDWFEMDDDGNAFHQQSVVEAKSKEEAEKLVRVNVIEKRNCGKINNGIEGLSVDTCTLFGYSFIHATTVSGL